MNKYWRAKKFKSQYQSQYQRYQEQKSRDAANSLRRKNNFVVGTVYLILLVCVVLYAICIHFNFFGVRDWDGIKEQGRQKTSASEPVAYVEHLVKPGETVWSIASRYHPNKDARKAVWAIRVFNAGPERKKMRVKIIPGQVVRVPMDIEALEEGRQVQEAAREQESDKEVKLASRHEDGY